MHLVPPGTFPTGLRHVFLFNVSLSLFYFLPWNRIRIDYLGTLEIGG